MLSKDIIEFYSYYHIDPEKAAQIAKKKGVPQAQFYAALEHCCYKIINGKKVAGHEIFRYVINVARQLSPVDNKWYEKLTRKADKAYNKLEQRLEQRLFISNFLLIFSLYIIGYLLVR